jgi:hypothetical protein
VLSLDEVTLPEELFETERFQQDVLDAEALADFNLATYLMKHQDGRLGHFLISQMPGVRTCLPLITALPGAGSSTTGSFRTGSRFGFLRSAGFLSIV